MITIDRSSPVPLYFQFAQQLQHLIETGVLPPGTRLSNEVTMADQFGLSRPTMRQAMQHLVDKGLLARKRGVGTQVVANRIRRQLEFTSLYEDLARDRRHPATEVLSIATVPAEPEVAAALHVPEGAEVVALQRLRLADGEPIALETTALIGACASAVMTADLTRGSLHETLGLAGFRLRRGTGTIAAAAATAEDARQLGMRTGEPLLVERRVIEDEDGRRVEATESRYVAERYALVVQFDVEA
jgi:DNA-binding GntR family transcriptional regulator